MNAMQKSVTLAGALALAMTFGGCGEKDSNCAQNPNGPSCPSPTPVTITETIVIFGDNGPVPAEDGGFIDFAIPSAGTVEATVDWTFASSQVAVAMTMASCNDAEAAFLGSCSHIGNPNLTRAKPKTVSGTVSQAGTGRLWLLNLAPVDESMAVQITLTRTRSAAAPAPVEFSAWNWVRVPSAAVRAVRAFRKD
jgi:hypothetical protein